MRKDMDRVIVERARIGSREPSKKTGKRLTPGAKYDDGFDSGPRLMPSGRGSYPWAQQKELNDNLRPLRAFLLASVGRNWNKVYSEIREQVDHRKTMGFHLLQHLNQMLQGSGNDSSMGLYVDLKTGVLRKRRRS